jgi:hypothetical protein
MRLFKQSTLGDWSEPVEQVKLALSELQKPARRSKAMLADWSQPVRRAPVTR